jgi:hypothetical protein
VGHRLVVIIGNIVISYLIGSGLPHPVVGHDVAENVVQVFHPVGLANKKGVQGNAHYFPALGPLFVKLVKLGLTNAGEIVGFIVEVT